MDDQQLDPEMLKNLDMLLDLDVIEDETEWPLLENVEEVQKSEEVES